MHKLNPLQRITYFSLKAVIIPVQIVTGLIYLYYPILREQGQINYGLEIPALINILMAFLLIAFLIVHMYLSSAGSTLKSNVKAMITGYEDL